MVRFMRFDKTRSAALALLIFSVGSSLQSSPDLTLVYKKKYVMGTVFEIAAYGKSSANVSAAIDEAFHEIVRIDDLMSNYKPESALSTLNRSAHFHTERVPSELYRVIEEAVHLSQVSEGKFDITVAPLVDLWKAALSGESIPSPVEQERARACVGYEKIHLIPPDQVMFRSPCLQIDLGAIGKGYAVDRAAEILQALRIQDAFISAGGSTILALGSPPGQTAWMVHLRDLSGKIDPYVMLKDGSVSTSEQTAPSLLGRTSAGHIIDLATGKPLNTPFAVSVVAPTGTMSDGLSTTLLLLGPGPGKLLVKQTPYVSALWLSPQAQIEVATNGPQIRFDEKL